MRRLPCPPSARRKNALSCQRQYLMEKIVAKVLKARKGAPPWREMRGKNTEFAPSLRVLFYVFKVFRFLIFIFLISCFY